MKTAIVAILITVGMLACKNPKPDVSGNAEMGAGDFVNAFSILELPVVVADTSLKMFGDTAVISTAAFKRFIPDSSLQSFSFKQTDDIKIYPAGKIHYEERDYLLAKFSSSNETKLGVFVLDDKHAFRSFLPLLNSNKNDGYNHSVSITTEPAFIMKKEKITADNKSLYSRNGYAYNAATNSFEAILNDSNEDTAKMNKVINPIDTFPSTNKFSGDYISNEKNFISVRDGKNAITYTFFIHFEKNKDCIGELKGMMSLTDEKNAVFNESGDPCVINFKFSGTSVIVKEEGNCGNHRGITCLYDFTFKKKKEKKETK